MADKTDLKRAEKDYFSAPVADFAEGIFRPYSYLMVDGQGSPGDSAEYRQALEALYPLAYATKFLSKAALGRDYVVPPLEGLWFAHDMAAYTQPGRRDEWRWTLMLMLPDWIEGEHVAEARAAKYGMDLSMVRMGRLDEGLSLSRLHLGPFADEAPVLHRLHHELIPQGGYAFNGQHHEIYLSDPRRTVPEKLKTILRQPVRRL
ncbi:GyrI-like domain-containing protein [Altererythrobacter sp. KTW20L]|uniref:GyrI-like domain-containing protein n=1 Tax=Altererythrobacter sp. KTW20L TaxID=2942210 RepID=UPI0020BF8BAF|nr:GyrI-like domain-containing protein [Altererythrobacter sp. KTW20L]MCL6250330.1 GyrI-like domain-containing protein [Altererythrobacter sp. KTW20L]